MIWSRVMCVIILAYENTVRILTASLLWRIYRTRVSTRFYLYAHRVSVRYFAQPWTSRLDIGEFIGTTIPGIPRISKSVSCIGVRGVHLGGQPRYKGYTCWQERGHILNTLLTSGSHFASSRDFPGLESDVWRDTSLKYGANPRRLCLCSVFDTNFHIQHPEVTFIFVVLT